MAETHQPAGDSPSALERRLTQAQRAGRNNDFDASSWAWMIVLGVLVPAALIVTGWLETTPSP